MNERDLDGFKSKANYNIHAINRELLNLRYLIDTSDLQERNSILSDIDLIKYNLNGIQSRVEYLEPTIEEGEEVK